MMSDEERDEILGDLIAARLTMPDMPAPQGVDPELWEEAGQLTGIAESLRARDFEVPPLEEDPVAATLGLVPDRHFALDSRALTRARKGAGMQTSELAAALVKRGWQVQGRDVFNWENRAADDVSPALITAIATVLGTTADHLRVDRAGEALSGLDAATQTSRFADLARRLAALRGIPESMAASNLRSRGLATVHRGSEPDADRWLDSLENYVAALETSREQ